jgi:1,4-alpha-glucan branching enzyme
VDAVASMLYLDYSRKPGEWVPNHYGGNENLDAILFLRRFNEEVYRSYPDVQTFAEESTAWPMVSRPVDWGGLGFGYKWNMGWMHDTLAYMSRDPVHRKFHHDQLTFSIVYAFSENYVLPLSHDEVVHGKGSILTRMPGDSWQRFANVRLLYTFMYAHPGKKLLFMGNEFAQEREWNHDASLDWHLTHDPNHAGIQRLVRDLNRLYTKTPALYERDATPDGFQWLAQDGENSIISFLRKGHGERDLAIVVCNFTPIVREGFRIGVPFAHSYVEVLNSDAEFYGGGDVGNGGSISVEAIPAHAYEQSISLRLPPLGAIVLLPSFETGA